MPAATARRMGPRPMMPLPRPRAEPARPLVDFQVLEGEIARMVQEAMKSAGKLPEMPKAKFESKYKHIGKNFFKGKKYWMHWQQLFGTILTRRGGGLRANITEKRRLAKIAYLRTDPDFSGKTTQAVQRYERKLIAALSVLQQKVETGDVRPDNVGYWRGELFDGPAAEARTAFRDEIVGIIGDYRKKLGKKKLGYSYPDRYGHKQF